LPYTQTCDKPSTESSTQPRLSQVTTVHSSLPLTYPAEHEPYPSSWGYVPFTPTPFHALQSEEYLVYTASSSGGCQHGLLRVSPAAYETTSWLV
jgi:hypothetical protein